MTEPSAMLSAMPESYRTIDAGVAGETEVRRSRFIARVEPAGSEEAARAVIAEARARHRQAGHHCSAFVLGASGALQRTNDDGEPSGTAGAPILDVLTGHGLTDVVAVVTRYFGGTLLGTGGLIRAYGGAVAEVLGQAGIVTRIAVRAVQLSADYALAAQLEAEARNRGWPLLGAEYGAGVRLSIGVPPAELVIALNRVAAISGAAVTPSVAPWVVYR